MSIPHPEWAGTQKQCTLTYFVQQDTFIWETSYLWGNHVLTLWDPESVPEVNPQQFFSRKQQELSLAFGLFFMALLDFLSHINFIKFLLKID